MILCFLAFARALCFLFCFLSIFVVIILFGRHKQPALMDTRLLWQSAIVVIVT